MKSNYTQIWLLLTVSMTVTVMMAFNDDVSIGSWTLKKAPLQEFIAASGNQSEFDATVLSVDSVAIPDDAETAALVETDTVPKNIFMFGDSMTLNLALRLAKYAKQNGHSFHAVNWDSSNTKIWAETDTLRHYLKKYNPDFIFICLGSNEVYFKKPESRLPYIQKILKEIGNTPYVWIGPPNWNNDTGINDVLRDACAPRSFFRSAGMNFKRKEDKIHPTRASSRMWADSIMRWLPESAHPILNEVPSDSIGKVKSNIVILKALNK